MKFEDINLEGQERLNEMKNDYEKCEVPLELKNKIEESINRAEKEKGRSKVIHFVKGAGMTAVAAMLVLTILVNTNQNVAMAMSEVPVLGSIVRAVTFRTYQEQSENHEANVKVPNVVVNPEETENPAKDKLEESTKKINMDIEAYTNKLIEEYKSDIESDGEIHKGLDIDSEVIRDDDRLYIIKLWAVETMASGAQTERYYTLDKTTGEQVTFPGLFKDGADYVKVISENIKEQMREQMKNPDDGKIYFLDDPDAPDDAQFTEIKADQNFYINDQNKLVIVFDEYDVAPGYMGMCYFEIPTDVLQPLLKDNELIK
ncbi:RsiV family protein [Diplocloster agilis]|uniref:RsiV family protein n=1 Tax=Diplocloster agilis TaxID=2850323 RepID=A0A949NCY9_9FIRM|nr:RsiV family protein [Diplocloster agilis]MBU9739262.1 RsiV family protein [Diplocloster agilis]